MTKQGAWFLENPLRKMMTRLIPGQVIDGKSLALCHDCEIAGRAHAILVTKRHGTEKDDGWYFECSECDTLPLAGEWCYDAAWNSWNEMQQP